MSAFAAGVPGAARSTVMDNAEAPEGGRAVGTRKLDVVVLAGGTGRRLGGASKPDVVVRGARLLDHVLGGIERVRAQLPPGDVVVVAPPTVAVPAGVLRALEDPPWGGPVAGIAAGLARLAALEQASETEPPGPAGAVGDEHLTAVVTCDAPDSWRALPVLLEALENCEGAPGACAVDGDHVQYLLGAYRTAALAAVVAPGGVALRDVAVRRVLGRMDLVHVNLEDRGDELARAAHDLDTWEDIRAYSPTPTPRDR
ncbi:Molybdopterin-guanine dinucleotide biosynthesis protein A [Actinomyces ruminicola]|uniref:Molybdopterin-guanine dinucleotide biosynthesis protein A n=2 Tax=Actinomyces ruminicola TaxID=332524 RepID=A0A1H0DM64_9ACTO|nr:Molybdopterin-guanine dinucleotide biosynthesis protein A [Actinomyces ruminicola]